MHRFKILSKGLRRKRGEMNKTEKAYSEHLDAQIAAGEIHSWWFEAVTLRLSRPEQGQPARYAPDFLVLMPDGVTYLDDVKSGGFDDFAAGVRIKCAAEQYPLWKFRIVKRRTKKLAAEFGGDIWARKEV